MSDDQSKRVRPLEPDGQEAAIDLDRAASQRTAPPTWVLVGGALAVGLLIGWVIGASRPETGGALRADTTVSSIVASEPVSELTPTTTLEIDHEERVGPLTDVGWLRRPVALIPLDDDTRVILLDADGSVQSSTGLAITTTVPQPILWSDDTIIFVGPGGANRFLADRLGASIGMGENGRLVPGASPDRVWLVDAASEWVVAADTASGAVGQRIDTSGEIETVFGGVAEGLLVAPTDVTAHGRVAYWSEGLGVQALEVPGASLQLDADGQTGPVTSAGNTAVLVSPNAMIDIVDIARRKSIAQFPVDLGGGLLERGCLGPGQHLLALVSSTGRIVVTDIEGTVLREVDDGTASTATVAWTTPDQLLRIVDTADGRRLRALDVFTGSEKDVAALDPTVEWLLATPDTWC